jgi:ketosteroid isomerase-like protein
VSEANLQRAREGLDRWNSGDVREIGDRVLVVGRVRAKGRSSGIELDQPLATVCWFRGGKFARMQSFLDYDAATTAASREATA